MFQTYFLSNNSSLKWSIFGLKSSSVNSTLLFYQYLCWKSIQGKTSSLNSSSIQGKRVCWTRFPCILFFHSQHNEHGLIKCAIANTIWSSADAARSDQVRHQVLDTIWSWRNHQVQTQPDLIKQPAKHDLIRKRVQWTRFPCILFFTTNRRSQPALDMIWSSADAVWVTCWG